MGRTNNFDALRLLAALFVVLSHMAALSGRKQWLAIAGQTWGSIGVLIFFSISGYLVTASWRADPDLGRFLAKRFLRIAPGLLTVLPLTCFVVYLIGQTGFPGNPMHALNGSLWTIEYEVMCYLLLVAMMLALPHPAIVGVALSFCAYLIWPNDYLAQFAPFFAIGSALSAYPILRSGRASALLLAMGATMFLYHHMLGLALIVPVASIWIGSHSWPLLREVPRIGDLSYGIYIYAWPVQQIVVAFMGPASNYWALLAATLAVLIPIAFVSWRFVEEPALRLKPARAEARVNVSSVYN